MSFNVSRGGLQLGLVLLLASWLAAYGLGRRANVTAPSAELALRPSPLGGASAVRRPPEAPTSPGLIVPTSTPARDALDQKVKLEAPASPAEVLLRTEPPTDGFGIQIGAYPERAEAEAAVARLAEELEGLEIYLIPVEIPGKGTWYRLRLGHFESRSAADLVRKNLSVAEGALSLPYR